MTDVPKSVNRVVVIDSRGNRLIDTHADEWEVLIEDDAHTVKLIGKGDGAAARLANLAALGAELKADMTRGYHWEEREDS